MFVVLCQTAFGDQLVPFWWRPELAEVTGLTLLDIASPNDGETILLAERDWRPGLFIGANESGPGQYVSLPIEGHGLRMAVGPGDIVWIGGFTNDRIEGFGSGHFSDAYLAKLDKRGQVVWQRTYGGRSKRNILSIAPLVSGDIAVAGTDDFKTWLARISSDGEIVWERFFGRGQGAVLSTNGELLVAAFEAGDDGKQLNFPQNVALWRFNESGAQVDHRVVREAVNVWASATIGKLWIKQSGEATYVFSEGQGVGTANPMQVIKIDVHGRQSGEQICRKQWTTMAG
jgi:hypothetical protein